MVIRKMNTVLVKHNKILFGFFTIIIIISFVWFFIPGLDGSILFGNASSPDAVVGTVFGRKITQKQYQQAYRDRILLLEAITGTDGQQFHSYLEQRLLEDIARETAAEIMGITATDEEVANFIRNACAIFRGKDGFDPELYRKFAQRLQESDGRSITEFENLVRKMLAANKLDGEISSGIYLTPDEKEHMAVLMKEKFNARMIEFPFRAYANIKRGSEEAKKKGLGESDMLNYYKANTKRFMTAPQLRAVIVCFPYVPANYAPSDQELQAYYKAHEHDFMKDGKVLPLAKVRGKVAEAIRQEKARNVARAAAKKFRDDLYTASEANDKPEAQIPLLKQLAAQQKLKVIETPWFTEQTATIEGIGSEPELAAALFRQTNPQHKPLLSASFKGANGCYVAGSVGLKPSVPAQFKDVQDQVWEMLLDDYARRAASEAAHNFAHKMNSAKPDELAALAQKAGGKVTAINGFTREAQAGTQAQWVAMQQATRLPVHTISQPQEVPGGMMLVYLDSCQAPSAAEKEDAVKQIENMLRYSKQIMQQGSFNTWMANNIQSNLPKEKNEQ
ncbi:MAG: SurA N-terminal domain-containing protein [Lentisphaeria bacterium]|nr:SurA N-terminal domain-containing protein [Lentisphaeria bacterium]